MTLKHLSLSSFRNFSNYSLDFSPGINAVYGVNGIGKTSILEAIYLLGTGRSFRTNNLNLLMTSTASATTVYAEVEAYNKFEARVGYHRERGQDKQLKLNQHKVASISEIAAIFPVCCLEINIFMALLQPPEFRRRILDWGVFHVKHDFFDAWKNYNQVLKQRNTILKQAKDSKQYINSKIKSEVQSWDKLFAQYAIKLATLRQAYLDEIKPFFQQYIKIFIDSEPEMDMQLSIKHGLPGLSGLDEQKLQQELAVELSNDLYKGYTGIGPHKADLIFSAMGTQAKNILSRGQQKVLIIAYYLAQLTVLKEKYSKNCTVLIDDLASELDIMAQNRIYEQFARLGHQLIISTVDEATLPVDVRTHQLIGVSRETNKNI